MCSAQSNDLLKNLWLLVNTLCNSGYIAKSNYNYKNVSWCQISLSHKHWHTYSLLLSIFRRVGSDYYSWPWIQQRRASPWEREGVLWHLPEPMRWGDGRQTSHDRIGLQGADLWEYSHHREWCHNRLCTLWRHGWLIGLMKLPGNWRYNLTVLWLLKFNNRWGVAQV